MNETTIRFKPNVAYITEKNNGCKKEIYKEKTAYEKRGVR
jgi:hypothetical protein